VRLATALVALLALLLAGCTPRKSSGTTPKAGTGDRYEKIGDVNPGSMIPAKATLKIGEIDMPVEVSLSQNGADTTFTFSAHGQTFETESYENKQTEFSLVDAAGERYNPPLPLLKFPMNVGDTWDWVGSMVAGEEPHKATATITTSSETILLPATGNVDSILVVVDLSIESGGPKPATRKLRFWFVPNKGLLKRQFGSASSREPLE
jgi:hypothetical protein